jgi:hypothetical protein
MAYTHVPGWLGSSVAFRHVLSMQLYDKHLEKVTVRLERGRVLRGSGDVLFVRGTGFADSFVLHASHGRSIAVIPIDAARVPLPSAIPRQETLSRETHLSLETTLAYVAPSVAYDSYARFSNTHASPCVAFAQLPRCRRMSPCCGKRRVPLTYWQTKLRQTDPLTFRCPARSR